AFQKLVLPKSWAITYIEWIEHIEGETLVAYCIRLSQQVNTSAPFSLVGLSFGGIVAVELAKIIQPVYTILISSVSTSKELPISYASRSFIRKLHLQKLIPATVFSHVNSFTYWLFGTKTTAEKELLKAIITDTPPHFAKWAFGEIITWENTQKTSCLFHIHGTEDRLFPYKKVVADVKVNGGGHFMVFSHAAIISKLLIEKIS
ncbi:MAG: alpha/beta hydrolase, partial [Sphingobacteriales bacterium]|nr:alpha/beta hydrolase [Sphingobacteriales bacterium]